MRKKTLWVAVWLVLVFGIVSSANADDVVPRYVYVNKLLVDLQVYNGSLKASGKISSYNDEKTSITVCLQQQSSTGYWRTVCTWTDTDSNGDSSAGGSKRVAKGYDDRAYAIGKVYNSSDSVVEILEKYSSVISY